MAAGRNGTARRSGPGAEDPERCHPGRAARPSGRPSVRAGHGSLCPGREASRGGSGRCRSGPMRRSLRAAGRAGEAGRDNGRRPECPCTASDSTIAGRLDAPARPVPCATAPTNQMAILVSLDVIRTIFGGSRMKNVVKTESTFGTILCGLVMAVVSFGCAEARPRSSGPDAAAASQPASDGKASPEAQERRRKAAFEAEAAKRETADRIRMKRLDRLSNSICTGCGGPAVPFDPTGGKPSLQKPRPPAQAR
ncbi:hypothetical protein GMJLKIPL_4255 [Methylobacterium isbiliense]|uniref:Uncharacterized protein n=1 Tax=Methylobacterium isbiliense TaxID=315478 RepID=A0ABQ4SIP8_9HYPH|nr:hypothetical protein GMJLKIPL_4255 [Methylobacterium isbiliense]